MNTYAIEMWERNVGWVERERVQAKSRRAAIRGRFPETKNANGYRVRLATK